MWRAGVRLCKHPADLAELCHQVSIHVLSPGRIDNEYVNPPAFCRSEGIMRDRCSVRPVCLGDYGNPQPVAP